MLVSASRSLESTRLSPSRHVAVAKQPSWCPSRRNLRMKAIGCTKYEDGSTRMVEFEAEKPTVKARDILVRVDAVSVNPVDYKVRTNFGTPETEAPHILGWDCAGEVVAVGEQASLFKVGDYVWYAGDLTRPGTNAEYHAVDERIVGKKPTSVSMSAAAALPLTTLTAYEMLFDRLRVKDPVAGGARAVVIIGGSGGVGSIAIQLLRALTDLTIIATASRPETQLWCKDLGAHHVVDHSLPLAKQIKDLGVGEPSYVFSTTHTHLYIPQVAEFIAPQGRFGLIDDPENFDIMPLFWKAISVHWEFMYTRSMHQTADMIRQHEILNEVSALVDAGKVKTTAANAMGKVTALNVEKAHSLLMTNKSKGKIVLEGF